MRNQYQHNPRRNNKTFDDWKAEVDKQLSRRTGLTSDGIMDYDYYAAWDAGLDPSQTAEDSIHDAMEY